MKRLSRKLLLLLLFVMNGAREEGSDDFSQKKLTEKHQ